MYVAHPVFVQPADQHVKVWRYMDFAKLLSMIDSRRLFFTRADRFEDPFECSWPKINVTARQTIPTGIPADGHEAFMKAMASMGDVNKLWPKYVAVNCWHMNEHESAAMWRLYLKGDEGIALQSTYEKLRSSIEDDEQVFVGVVKYIDYDTEWIDARNTFSAFVHKRKSFEHEREVRALVVKYPISNGGFDFRKETIGNGLSLAVDIGRLVEKIYVAPSSPLWFVSLVRAVIQRYGYDFPVMHSRLNEEPVY